MSSRSSGMVTKVVPVEAMGGCEYFVDLQLPPAYNLVVEPSASHPSISTFVPHPHSTTELDDQRLPTSGPSPPSYYEVGSDPSSKSPRLKYDPVSSVSTGIVTPPFKLDPRSVAITTAKLFLKTTSVNLPNIENQGRHAGTKAANRCPAKIRTTP